MRRNPWTALVLIVPIFCGCAAAPAPPAPEVRSELTPTGALRAGILLTTALQVTGPVSGELKGVSVDLSKALARRLGVRFVPIGYNSIAELIAGGRQGKWDIAFLVVEPSREKDLDYAGAHMEVELSYLVPAGSSIRSLSDVDRPGVRVTVAANGGPDILLSRTLKQAVVVRAPDVPGMAEFLRSGKADAMAANKPTLLVEAEGLSGSRVLDGRFSTAPYGVATPKGRPAANAYVRRFVEESKTDGLIKSAIENAGLRGVVVASPR